MNHDDDVRVRGLLKPADPIPSADSLTEDAWVVRSRIATRLSDRWRLPVAAAVAVLLVGMVVPYLLPPAAWAMEETADGGNLIRVELPEFYRRGADPEPLVAALREQGVVVEVVDQLDLTPWKAGRIVGIGFTIRGPFDTTPAYCEDPSSEQAQQELFDEHGVAPRDGVYTVAPDVFEGTIEIKVGRFPGQFGTDPDS